MNVSRKLIVAGIFVAMVFVLPFLAQAQYYYNYNNCTYHAYKDCIGNNIYWFGGCQQQQDLYYTCPNGQICQYGQCLYPIIQPVAPPNSYNPYYRTGCYNNSIYWFDSLGVVSGLYESCKDANSCTLDTCYSNKCSHALKCDGSTCAAGSVDYNKYCAASQSANQQQNQQQNQPASGLSISFFAKQNPNSNQWQKTVQASSNSTVYFMISSTNSSTAQIDNVNISANIPSEISSLGNLQLNGVAFSGDIVSGINIGSVAPGVTKLITFEGKTQTISSAGTKQATSQSNISSTVQSDSVSINFMPGQSAAAASVSGSKTTSGFWTFLKRWYLWILVGLVMIFLFIVVFRRLSSNE